MSICAVLSEEGIQGLHSYAGDTAMQTYVLKRKAIPPASSWINISLLQIRIKIGYRQKRNNFHYKVG